MSDAASTWWGITIGALLVGLPALICGGPISRWNRQISRRGWWQVPSEEDAESTWWGQRYTRTLGAVCTSIAVLTLVVALVKT